MLSILVMSTHTHEKCGGHLDSSLFFIFPSFLTSFYSFCFVSLLSDHSLPSAPQGFPFPLPHFRPLMGIIIKVLALSSSLPQVPGRSFGVNI